MSDFTNGFMLGRPFKVLKRDIREGRLNPHDFLKQGLEELAKTLDGMLRSKATESDFSNFEETYQEVRHFIKSERKLGVNLKPYDDAYDELIKLVESEDTWTNPEKEYQKFQSLLRKKQETGHGEAKESKLPTTTAYLGFPIQSP